ncbi:MAG: HAMP domain-containing histidine kinase [Verrucomicrobia bacterium]|nr:MAG: HAMP domain-containing histidine kinase [Verrucomicrobiota bacterium]
MSTTEPAASPSGIEGRLDGERGGTMLSPMNPPRRAEPRAQTRLRAVVFLQIGWIAFLSALGGWWVAMMSRQAGQIADLERQLGVGTPASAAQWARTERMLHWEGATFFGALFLTLAFIAWLYWRDSKRARALQGFFASVTHELRTPLAGIRLEAESLAELVPSGTEARTLVDRLLDDSSRLEAQVERALELARVEGEGTVHATPLNPRALVGQLVRHWHPAGSRRVAIDNQVEDGAILADVAALQIILRNLLENAARHARRDPITVRISSRESDGWVELVVADDGGTPEDLPHGLGSLFAKGTESRGAGVGLYLVKSLVKRMGGSATFGPTTRPGAAPGFQAVLRFRREVPHG